MSGKIYVTSDLHFGHDKEFLYGPRGFDNIWEHDKAIIENWNSIVDMDDDVYVLGDLMLKDNFHGINCIKQLKGRIHVILGNHDSDAREAEYYNCYNIVEIEQAKMLKYGKYRFFLCHYPTLCSNFDDGKSLNHCVISLCGHTHTKDKWHDYDKGRIYHCDLDAHDNKPVLIDDIISDFREKIDDSRRSN